MPSSHHAPSIDIDEMMRLQPTISIVSRIASQEVTYHDVAFPAGTLFRLFLGSANVDEDVFGPAPFDSRSSVRHSI